MTSPIQTVSVIGLGYVGLPTAATLASRGLGVVGVDIRPEVVDRINEGQTHIIEPDLDMIVQAVVQAGALRAATAPEPVDAFMIAVPTPLAADNTPDMTAVTSAVRSIAPHLRPGTLVVIESTSPVGTTRGAADLLQEMRPDLTFPHTAPEESDVMIAYCPERILPGQTIRELVDNARIIGGLDRRSTHRAHELYSFFAQGEMVLTEAPVAEMTKLTENAFRDVNIAFANELSLVCDTLKINVWDVIGAANLHPRVNILAPGPGVGGHCIPIDPWFIHYAAPERSPLIRTAREVNHAKTEAVTRRIGERASDFRSPVIALLGLAYKPNVDDLRESPAVEIAAALAREGAGEILAVEPHVKALPEELAAHSGIRLATLDEALARAQVIAVLVPHKQFARLDRAALVEKVVVDVAGLFNEPARPV